MDLEPSVDRLLQRTELTVVVSQTVVNPLLSHCLRRGGRGEVRHLFPLLVLQRKRKIRKTWVVCSLTNVVECLSNDTRVVNCHPRRHTLKKSRDGD